MSEAKILQAIADKVKDDRLHFQVIVRDNAAHIYINRDTEDYIDHRELAETIQSAISALDELNLIEIGLYSRILGEVEPDWQTFVEFTQEAASIELAVDEIVDEASNTDSSIVEVEPEFEIEQEVVSDASLDSEQIEESTESKATETIPDSEQPQDLSENKSLERSQISTAENKDASNSKNSIDLNKESIEDKPAALDLSQYCFIRNKRLLNADLVVPQEKIAQIIDTFHNFDESIKRSQLPILESYFKDGTAPDTNDFASDIETWWAEIQELEANVKRKLAIWLSRYCLDPVATIATVESVFEAKAEAKKAAEETAREKAQQKESSDANSADRQRSSQHNSSTRNTPKPSKSKFDLNSGFVLPISWILITLAVMVIGLNSAETSNALAAICEGSQDREYCQLAVQIMGEEELQTFSQNAPQLKEESIDMGLMFCEVHGNIAAGIPLKKSDPIENPLLYTDGAEILPGIYLADVEQTNTKNGNPTVRTVCILQQTHAKNVQRSMNVLNTEQIDPDWPEIAYEPSERISSLRSLTKAMDTYITLGWFGLNTFYTAVALYLLAICGMAIKAYSLQTIYQASFILGVVEGILASLPVLGLWISIPLECVALGITSACVKGFKVDWGAGYYFVAASAMLLIFIRALLCWSTLAFLVFILN